MDDQSIFELEGKEIQETFLKALKNDAHAMYVLAMLLKDKQRNDDAITWLKKAADQQYALAQYELANYYYAGDDIEVDENKAFELYEAAAKNGHADAANNLADMYLNGVSVEVDEVKALEWFT